MHIKKKRKFALTQPSNDLSPSSSFGFCSLRWPFAWKSALKLLRRFSQSLFSIRKFYSYVFSTKERSIIIKWFICFIFNSIRLIFCLKKVYRYVYVITIKCFTGILHTDANDPKEKLRLASSPNEDNYRKEMVISLWLLHQFSSFISSITTSSLLSSRRLKLLLAE